MKKPLFPRLLLASSIALALAACGGGGGDNNDDDIDGEDPVVGPPTDTPPVQQTAGDTYAVTASNKLITFNRAAAEVSTVRTTVAIGGLAEGENITDIDFRPSNNLLYGLTSAGRVVTINPADGVTTTVKTLAADALQGTNFGIDFDPLSPDANLLRVVSNTGQSLRVNVDAPTGGVVVGAGFGSAVEPTDVAYTGSFAGSNVSTVLVIDSLNDQIGVADFETTTSGSPSTVLNPKTFGADIGAVNGFDIDGRNNVGYAAVTANGTQALYTVSPGAVTSTSQTPPAATALVGTIGAGEEIRGIAIPTPVVTVQALAADGLNLFSFSPLTPNTVTPNVAIAGLNGGETVLGIDVRPSDGQLYAVTTAGRILAVDPATGATTLKSQLPPNTLTSPEYTVDFNPTGTTNRLRLVGSNGDNFAVTIDTETATVAAGPNVFYAPGTTGTPNIVAGAYTNNFAGTAGTDLRVIDRATGRLYIQNVGTGELTPVTNAQGTTNDLGPTITGDAGYDVVGGSNALALGAFTTNGVTSLYRVPSTGIATPINADAAQSRIGNGGTGVRGIAIVLR